MFFKPPELKHFCDVSVQLDSMIEMGNGRAGKRRIIPIIGGDVSGERITGRVLNIGADWQTVLSDGTAHIDTRYVFENHDGAVIEIINRGFRHGAPEVIDAISRGEDVDPSDYYMRTSVTLESGDSRYQWVNNRIFIGRGGKVKSTVKLCVFEVL